MRNERLFALLLAATALMWLAQAPAQARARIETGRDLAAACQLAVEHRLQRPQAPLSGKARYCRQYINGYFGALDALQKGRGTQKVHPHNEKDYVQCAQVPRVGYMEDLEKKISRAADWHPELLDKPAVELVMQAFNVIDPC
ncbi:conserved protein [Tepidicaulis marinus]|uniref:Conserved protein n=1 Tax=Tepidicaulis marinus TaxID=1333998 RepID=A0A081BAN6_9HYPH|nr:Rap1a/Tai family immunity protein [Tepidicaulis marinus]GAK45104.1 conserved protein [Tepidicaulis marinus]